MAINFTKMNSQGNDFIVIDVAHEIFIENQDNIKKICSMGEVGCDQLLLINTRDSSNVSCTIYNQDGSNACQCGNGLRAIMLYLNKKFQIVESTINVCDVDYRAQILDKDKISVELGSPSFPGLAGKVHNTEDSSVTLEYAIVDVGNIHCVVATQHNEAQRDTIIKKLYSVCDEWFGKPNVTFILNAEAFKKDPTKHLKIKVKERGAGWTKSCGSGAVASAAFMIRYGLSDTKAGKHYLKAMENIWTNLQPPINVEQEGGVLEVSWNPGQMNLIGPEHLPNLQTSLRLLGPSEIEYDGVWNG